MTALIVHVPEDRSTDGPAMSALTDQQRAFVYAMITHGVNPNAADQCAVAAGYEGKNGGWRCMRNERILAALHEESKKRLVGAALTGVNVMIDIANTPGHKDQFKAAKELAAINGFTVEQKITVTHIQKEQGDVISQIREKAERLGLDPRPFLLQAGVSQAAIDAEFVDITDVTPVDDWSGT